MKVAIVRRVVSRRCRKLQTGAAQRLAMAKWQFWIEQAPAGCTVNATCSECQTALAMAKQAER
jgi:hypothetical protein